MPRFANAHRLTFFVLSRRFSRLSEVNFKFEFAQPLMPDGAIGVKAVQELLIFICKLKLQWSIEVETSQKGCENNFIRTNTFQNGMLTPTKHACTLPYHVRKDWLSQRDCDVTFNPIT